MSQSPHPQPNEAEQLLEIFDRDCMRLEGEAHDLHDHDEAIKQIIALYIAKTEEAVRTAIRHVVGAEIDPKYLKQATADVLAALNQPREEQL